MENEKIVKISDGREISVKEVRVKQARSILRRLPDANIDLPSVQKEIEKNQGNLLGAAYLFSIGLDLLVYFAPELTNKTSEEIDNLRTDDARKVLEEVIKINSDFLKTQGLEVEGQKAQDQSHQQELLESQSLT